MLLRSGKIYKPKIAVVKKYNLLGQRCCICSMIYKRYDNVSSCSYANLQRHSFHTECLSIIKKYNSRIITCPYCRQKLYKPTRVIVI